MITQGYKTTALFVYGTLTDKAMQEEVIGRIPERVPDTLLRHTLSHVEIDSKTYPAAEPRKGSRIDGIVIFVTHEELKMVDEYETAAYARKMCRLKSGNRAWVYVKRPH